MNLPTISNAQIVKNSHARQAGVFCWDNIKSEQTYYPGMVIILSQSRDCDGTYGQNLTAIPATQEHLTQYTENFYDSLEGPGHLELLTLDEAVEYIADRDES